MNRLRSIAPAGTALLLALVLLASAPALAQTVCRTANCALSATPPAECQGRAAPRTLRSIAMEGNGIIVPFRFAPSGPKIEPGDCIDWVANTVVHSSSDNACLDDLGCGSPSPSACLYDTGNVASTDLDRAAVCHYDPTDWPAATDAPFYCRVHATPGSGTMRGTLHVTTEIDLTVDKSGTDVALTWTGGGIPTDETFDVVRSTDDPAFPAPARVTFLPNNGNRGHNDPNELANPANRYYLIVNRN